MFAQNSKSGYFTGLDGLRAVAVIGVMLYHFGMPWMRGGFLGVESFFVVSGFLITSLLLADWERLRGIDFKHFWQRRAKRLLPAMYALIVACLAFTVLFLPDEVARLRTDALAAAAFVGNWQFILTQQSYFEAAGRPSLLRHLWSLAIEWQFYLIWPLACLALFRLRKWPAVVCVLAAAIGSAVWMALLYVPDLDPSRVYFGTDTRASGLLIGAALALLATRGGALRSARWARVLDVCGLLALGALAVAYVQLDEMEPALYRGGFFVVGLLTVVCVAAATQHRKGALAGLLSLSVLRWIGLRSYGLYLWHWPVIALTRPGVDVAIDGTPLFALRLAVTFVLAELSFRLIETPFRSGALGRTWNALRGADGAAGPRRTAGWVGAGTLAAAAMLLTVATFAARPSTAANQLAAAQLESSGLLEPAPEDSAPAAPPPQPTAPAAVLQPTSLATATAAPESIGVTPEVPNLARIPENERSRPDQGGKVDAPAPAQNVKAPSPAFVVTTRTVDSRVLVEGIRPAVEAKTRVYAVGDSVMLGAAKRLRETFGDIDIDAQTSRLFKAGVEMVRSRRDKGLLGDVVIVHLGNNGPLNGAQLRDMLDALKDVPRVVVVTLRVPRTWEQADNALLRETTRDYPNVVLMDWNNLSLKQPGVLDQDGIHLRSAGASYYADLLLQAAGR